jgi:CDP-6-deoxy-D-xylo-4-hexulose-3-dehydrase
VATSNALKLVGLEPVYVDVNLDTFDIKPELIKKLLEEDNNADEYCMILPVHLMGYPCKMDEINAIAEEYNLLVIEDTSQAHGSKYNSKYTGSLSFASTYSFYIAHNIQVGEMGAVLTNDKKLYQTLKKVKANGRVCDCIICTRSIGKCPRANLKYDPRFLHDMVGYNFKTTEFQAALGIVQLKKFNEIIKKRQQNVATLINYLSEFSDVIILPKYSEDVSYLAFPIVLRKDMFISREDLMHKLYKEGVESRPLFGSIPTQQPAYHEYYDKYKGKLPNADYLGTHGFYIGCHQYLTKDDLYHVKNAFHNALER